MSTIVVVKKNGAVAMGADTLTTFGSRKVSAVHNRQQCATCSSTNGSGRLVRAAPMHLGAMQAVYDGPHEALSIAEAAVRAAIEFDESTGGPVESYVVSPAAARAAEDFDLLLKV